LATRWLIGGGLAGVGLADLGAANARLFAPPGFAAVSVAMGWQLFAGPAFVAAGTGRQALVQTRVADAYRGRVFGALGAVVGGAMLIGFAIGGLLGDVTGLVPTLSAGGLVRLGGGLLILWLLPRGLGKPVPSQAGDPAAIA
jgi:hypothetical protein